MGTAIPFSRRWQNEGDWELFGSVQATPVPRPEPRCCGELKRRLEALERTAAEHHKRLFRLERPSRLPQSVSTGRRRVPG